MNQPHVRFTCTRKDFVPCECSAVRWLDWERDFEAARDFHARNFLLTRDDWDEARRSHFTYCGISGADGLVSMAAVWKYSSTQWELAGVRTKDGCFRKNFATMVGSFITDYIVNQVDQATCTTAHDNHPMQGVARNLGYRVIQG